jgi:hypothetical protein
VNKEIPAEHLQLRHCSHNFSSYQTLAIGHVEAAAEAAESGDGPKAVEYLKSAGQWVFDYGNNNWHWNCYCSRKVVSGLLNAARPLCSL